MTKRFYLALKGQNKDVDVEDALWVLADVLTGEGRIYVEDRRDLEGFVRENRYMWIGDRIQVARKEHPVSTEEERELEEKFRREYGQLPVYEFTIRKIGYTGDDEDATFEEDPFQRKYLTIDAPIAKELFPRLGEIIDGLVAGHGKSLWFEAGFGFKLETYGLIAGHKVGYESLSPAQIREFGFNPITPWKYDCTRIHPINGSRCNGWEFSSSHTSFVKCLTEEKNSPEKGRELYKKLRQILRSEAENRRNR